MKDYLPYIPGRNEVSVEAVLGFGVMNLWNFEGEGVAVGVGEEVV